MSRERRSTKEELLPGAVVAKQSKWSAGAGRRRKRNTRARTPAEPPRTKKQNAAAGGVRTKFEVGEEKGTTKGDGAVERAGSPTRREA